MSKAIVKHGGGLQRPDDAERIERAKAAIWQGRGLTPAPEIFDLYCVCARDDKPYTLRFERQASGLLRFKKTVKGKPPSLPDNARAGGKGWTLRLDYFENLAEAVTPCAWCGDGSFHHCSSNCGALVCGGRMRGNVFHCRKSCGASWVGVPMREITGTAGQYARMAAPPPVRGSLQPSRPAPGPARLCGICSGRMWTLRRGVYRCMAGCWHCPCCGGHFRMGEGCPCRSCPNCGEKALAGRACSNCGSPCPVRAPRRKTHQRANLRA